MSNTFSNENKSSGIFVKSKLALLLSLCSVTNAENPFNLVANEKHIKGQYDESTSIAHQWDVVENLSRTARFDKPPKHLQGELSLDSIVDCWEQSPQCSNVCN